MTDTLALDAICVPSDDVIAREIEGKIIIVVFAPGIGDMEDKLYMLNETGKAIWDRLDGARSLGQIAVELADEYDVAVADTERDVLELTGELARRKMLVVKQPK
jgi:hypothetical protein